MVVWRRPSLYPHSPRPPHAPRDQVHSPPTTWLMITKCRRHRRRSVYYIYDTLAVCDAVRAAVAATRWRRRRCRDGQRWRAGCRAARRRARWCGAWGPGRCRAAWWRSQRSWRRRSRRRRRHRRRRHCPPTERWSMTAACAGRRCRGARCPLTPSATRSDREPPPGDGTKQPASQTDNGEMGNRQDPQQNYIT